MVSDVRADWSRGATTPYKPGRIARLFRDGHAAAQHANLSAESYEPAGRTLLGLPPAALFI
jgi:hypothetical protein